MPLLTHLSIAAPTVTDARGKRIRPVDPVAERVGVGGSFLDTDARRHLARAIGPGLDRRLQIAVVIGLLGIGLVLGIILVAAARASLASGSLQLGGLAARAPALLGIEAGLAMVWIIARKRRADHIVAAALGIGRCPHCGQSLHDIPADPVTGETICTECGCAWRALAAKDPPQSGPST